jgi:hypothetical protein
MATAAKKTDSATPSNVTAIAKAPKMGTMQSGLIFKKKKTVTVPVLKLVVNAPAYVRVEQAMEVSKTAPMKKGGKEMEPATIMHCTDLNSDDECIVIVGTALKGILNDTYPDKSYVGKCFEITSAGPKGDKKYNTYTVHEIELEE